MALNYVRAVVVVAVISLPFSANAGLFSYMGGLFGGTDAVSPMVVTTQNIDLLQAALNPDPNPAKGGGDITIVGGTALLPETGPSGTQADIEEAQNNDTISIYVVRKGDTLGAIAKMFRVSTNTIAWANDISRGIIHEGDTLIILPISGVQHTVKASDTLQSIAKKYKADLKEILQFNNLEDNAKLAIGDTIIIPDGEMAVPVSVTRTPGYTPLRGASNIDYAGYYLRPVINGRRTQGLHGYNGVDLASYFGAPILAAAAGEAIIAKNSGYNGGYGNYIVIAHENGTQTLYGHMSSLLAYPGKRVVRGEVIGYMGSTGRSTGTHLHFEVRGAKNPF